MASKTQRLLEAPEILIQGGIDDGFSARLVQLAVSFLNELKGFGAISDMERRFLTAAQ